MIFVKKNFFQDENSALEKQNTSAEKPKMRNLRRKIWRQIELSTQYGYLIEKINFQPLQQKNTYRQKDHDSASE